MERRLDKSREVEEEAPRGPEGAPSGKEEEESEESEKRPRRGRREAKQSWLKKKDREGLRVKRECKRCEAEPRELVGRQGEREKSKRPPPGPAGAKERSQEEGRAVKREGGERNDK